MTALSLPPRRASKPITRPLRRRLLPDALPGPGDRADSPRASYPPVARPFAGKAALVEMRRRLRYGDGKFVMTTQTGGVTVTLAGCRESPSGARGCYFSDGAATWVGDVAPLWREATRQWPELATAYWTFALIPVFDAVAWAHVERGYRLRKGGGR
jgi:hypothetical protein